MGKSTIDGVFSIAMLNYQRVPHLVQTWPTGAASHLDRLRNRGAAVLCHSWSLLARLLGACRKSWEIYNVGPPR